MTTLAFALDEVAGERSASRLHSRSSQAIDSPRTRAIVALTLAMWISNFAIMMLRKAIDGGDVADAVTVRLGLACVGILLCGVIHAILSRFSPRSFARRAMLVSILALIAAETYAWISYFAFAAVDPSTQTVGINWSVAIYTVAFWTWFFLAWAGLYLALDYSFMVAQERERSSELQAQAYSAQLRALHNQINPHFLFNSLNSISALMFEERRAEADRMITSLSGFLRMTLSLDPFEDVALFDELALQRTYLGIEQLRYPDLEVAIELPQSLHQAMVPALILQPIIENAVKHGVQRSTPPARIVIRALKQEDRLVIVIEDSGKKSSGAACNGAGIGLKNVSERLAQRFGDQQCLRTLRKSDGFMTRIEMPLEIKP